jgi:VanZ family protein
LPDRLALTAWLATFAVIAWASLSPPDAQASGSGNGSLMTNLGHVPAYALLTTFTLWLAQGRFITRMRGAWIAAGIALAIGGGFECVQPLIGRDGNLTDVTLNATGVALALLIWSQGWRPKLYLSSR